MLLDEAGFFDCNPATLKMFACPSQEDFISKHPSFFSPERQPCGSTSQALANEHVAYAFQHGSKHFEWVHKRLDGSVFHADVRLTAYQIQEKSALQATVRDISEQKKRESIKNQLYQAQKLEVINMIGALVAGISHDFNNILASIHGATSLAKWKFGDNENFTTIETQTERAADMVKQLLAFSRQDIHQKKAIVLNDVVRDAARLAKLSISEKFQFNIEICHEKLTVSGDVAQLQQVIINLIHNSRDALQDSDTPVITLGVQLKELAQKAEHPFATSGSYACLFISDNGCGIDKKDMNDIFEPFFTTKDVGKGTGLGLSMVKGTIESHDGFIDVDSTVGEGTTFNIYLPLIETAIAIESDSATEAETAIKTDTKMIATASGQCILLVDDESMLREVNRAILEQFGYQVIEAADGLQAVEQFHNNQDSIKLVLMDVVMPRMGGIQAANKIRAQSTSVPIIFLTGYDRSQVLGEQEGELHNSAIMTKPFQIDELQRNIDAMISPK
ncbi:MAG: response regulator [Mariprofundus sp.]|nr:response regulator [Mariprofundus sp.]